MTLYTCVQGTAYISLLLRTSVVQTLQLPRACSLHTVTIPGYVRYLSTTNVTTRAEREWRWHIMHGVCESQLLLDVHLSWQWPHQQLCMHACNKEEEKVTRQLQLCTYRYAVRTDVYMNIHVRTAVTLSLAHRRVHTLAIAVLVHASYIPLALYMHVFLINKQLDLDFRMYSNNDCACI